MTLSILAVVLCAAVLHATWNGLLKGRTDRLRGIVVMTSASSVVGLVGVPLLPWPDTSSWPEIILSALLHVGYNLFLIRSYRYGALGQVYPIARGSSPMLVTLGAVVLAGDRVSGPMLAGIGLISAGIISLARGWEDPRLRDALIAALVTGLFIAGYTITDGIGGRRSGNPQAYAAWLFVLDGPPMVLIFYLRRGTGIRLFDTGPETLKSVAGGIVSLLAYGAVIWAASVAPMGAVSALRETSVVFAALIGRVVFKERLTGRRMMACTAVAFGAFLLA